MRPSVAAARAAWQAALAAAGCAAQTPAEEVPVARAAGRTTAAPVHAAWSVPAFACAAMDGIAVSAADTAAAPVVLPTDRFDEVDTGDSLPKGRDAVVMREHLVRRTDGAVALRAAVLPGQHVRPVGEDIRAGTLLLPAGHRLRAVDLAAAAGAGHRTLPVRRRPVVAIIPTGDEVRPVGVRPSRGEVLDTNSLLLATTCQEAGCATRVTPVQPDDPALISAAIRRAAMGADLVAVLAGSSAGRDDHTEPVVADLGSVVVHGVAVRPAHPVLLGVLRGPPPIPVIGVPGYPVSAALAAELFVVPLLADLQGRRPAVRSTMTARLAVDVHSRPELEEHVLVTFDADGSARPLRRGAGVGSAMVRAEAVLVVPAGCRGRAAGERIELTVQAGAVTGAAHASFRAASGG